MNNLIIGTAGHVDHGKTALVKALTGTDTDRLKEEKERGISIELGFAFLDLPGGKKAGIIDVPGHERFIKNMLAGVGGIDMVILVIAADEGVMPQTREHLDIIQLLDVKHGVVALTKTDMVDGEWIDLVREEVREFLKGSVLEEAPLIEVSAYSGKGLDQLRAALGQVATKTEDKRSPLGPLRMPVDRVFTVTGFGTVVTGTLLSGTVATGDVVELMPQSLTARVRSVQVHGSKVDRATAGQRTALNLTGLEKKQVKRGSMVAVPGLLKPTFRLDVRLDLIESAKILKNRDRVRVYLGTAEILGRVLLLDSDQLDPGSSTYAQLELEEEASAARGERFVIRTYSPMMTIGGGSVIDPIPQRHKRMRGEVLDALRTRDKGSLAEIALDMLLHWQKPATVEDIKGRTGLATEEALQAAGELTGKGLVRIMEAEGQLYYTAQETYRKWAGWIRDSILIYHRQYPLREGYPKEELRSRKFPFLNARLFNMLISGLQSENVVSSGQSTVSIPGFNAGPPEELKDKINSVMEKFRSAGMQPPAWVYAASEAGIDDQVSPEVLNWLVRTGILTKVASEMHFHSLSIEMAREALAEFFRTRVEITVGDARELFGTSRKYAMPLLEYFDRQKVTRRVGDVRQPGKEIALEKPQDGN